MEYGKQIEIKIEGNNCIINCPEQSTSSKTIHKIPSENSSVSNMNDLSLSISSTSEEPYQYNINKYKITKRAQPKNNYNDSNEKSKLEITYKSIFYSDLKTEGSNMSTVFELQKKENAENKKLMKDSVKKHLYSDSLNKRENKTEKLVINERIFPPINNNVINNYNKKINKNLNQEYFIHEKVEKKNSGLFKDNNPDNNNNVQINNEISNNNYNKNDINENININQELMLINNKRQKTECFSKNVVESNCHKKLNTEKIYIDSNREENVQTTNCNNNNKLILNKCLSKPNLKYRKDKVKQYFEKLIKNKSNEKTNILKFKSNNNFNHSKLKLKLKNGINQSNNNQITNIDKDSISNDINYNIKNDSNEKIISQLTSKKLFPVLKTTNSFNTSNNNHNFSSKTHIKEVPKNLLNNKIHYEAEDGNHTISGIQNNQKKKNLFTPKASSCSHFKINKKNNNGIILPKEDKNKEKEKDPILCKLEKHNSLLKNFLLNPNNAKKKKENEKCCLTLNKNNVNTTNYTNNTNNITNNTNNTINTNITNNVNNDNNSNISNNINNNFKNNANNGHNNGKFNFEEPKVFSKFSLKKYNTELKVTLKKNNDIDIGKILTDRNIKSNYKRTGNNNIKKYTNIDELINSIKS